MFCVLSAQSDLVGVERRFPPEKVVDASLGFIYQAEVPLFPKPGKHERCEVTESEVQIERQRRCQSSIKEEER